MKLYFRILVLLQHNSQRLTVGGFSAGGEGKADLLFSLREGEDEDAAEKNDDDDDKRDDDELYPELYSGVEGDIRLLHTYYSSK